ncbi:hypothetical protein CEXT_125821 [Caerostris extrusa]|uniref:Uncharacterized protein n=1 Tax=Caerostris extrusa TaxID=172846 RepID=A0AAV4QP76_CAEEX|nr:hypothetical protein CEXT_125821 [Caerostris extrusa]
MSTLTSRCRWKCTLTVNILRFFLHLLQDFPLNFIHKGIQIFYRVCRLYLFEVKMMFVLLALLTFLSVGVKADTDEEGLIPYLDDDILGINGNDLAEDDEDILPICDLTTYDPKMMQWRLKPTATHSSSTRTM